MHKLLREYYVLNETRIRLNRELEAVKQKLREFARTPLEVGTYLLDGKIFEVRSGVHGATNDVSYRVYTDLNKCD